jgi:hypothetical protein
MRFDTFCKTVNRIAAQRVKDEYGRKGSRLFIGHHIDYPDSMLEHYYQKGCSPTAAVDEIETNKGI